MVRFSPLSPYLKLVADVWTTRSSRHRQAQRMEEGFSLKTQLLSKTFERRERRGKRGIRKEGRREGREGREEKEEG